MLLLDSGGMFLKRLEDASRPELLELTAGAFLEALGTMRADAVNLGRTDLLLPPDLIARLAARAPFPLLSANVRDGAGKARFAASVVRQIGGHRVGIFGLAGTQPLAVAPLPGRDLAPRDPFEAARRAVLELRGTCDLVIALSALGLEEDARLARQVPGIDVILGSFSRAVTHVPRIEGQTIILHAGAKGMRLGRLELAVAPGRPGPWTDRAAARGGEPRLFAWSIVPLEASIPDEPRVAAILERHRQELRRRHLADREEEAGRPLPASPPAYVGAAACGGCHREEFLQWQGSKHARAFASLARKGREADPECLPCHVTAYGDPAGFRAGARGGPDLRSVQCEACHGFGREHQGPGKIRARVSEAVCRRCHTPENSPDFGYEPYLRVLGPHVARHFTRTHAPAKSP